MTDFLSSRLGSNVRVDLGDNYYCELRPLTKGDLAECQRKLSRLNVSFDENSRSARPSGELNVQAYQEEMVCRSIVSWNIDDARGVLPHANPDQCRAAYRRLPAAVADQIFEECDKLNAPPSKEEEARFRGTGDGGIEESEAPGATTGNGRVPDGKRVVEGAGALSS